MKENVMAGFYLLWNACYLIFLPVLFFHGIFKENGMWAIAQTSQASMDGFCAYIVVMPTIYLLIASLYILENPRLYQYLTFGHLKRGQLLRNEEHMYRQVFKVLEEIIEKNYYKKKNEQYTVKKEKSWDLIEITYYDETFKSSVELRLFEDYFYVSTKQKTAQYSRNIKPKDHDQTIYKTYRATLRSYLHEKNVERKQVKKPTKQEKEAQQKEKIKRQEKRHIVVLFEEIVRMKRSKLTKQHVVIEQEHYCIELQKQQVLVTQKNKKVFLKCTAIKGTPVVYLASEKAHPENQQVLRNVYENYIEKKTEEDVF